MQDGHQHLLAADGVHLLADDGLDLAHDAPAGRQKDVDAGGELAHEAGAHHQLVADGLGAGRVFFDGRQEELGEAHGQVRSRTLGDGGDGRGGLGASRQPASGTIASSPASSPCLL